MDVKITKAALKMKLIKVKRLSASQASRQIEAAVLLGSTITIKDVDYIIDENAIDDRPFPTAAIVSMKTDCRIVIEQLEGLEYNKDREAQLREIRHRLLLTIRNQLDPLLGITDRSY